ncbi:hypothetical protein C7Q35_08235 [Staphylococcus aureus]|nr:hypothetical protein C7Q35_08235 [Staphylococcus aureus]PZK73199.1 hypothetical protein C7Q17_00990 [Staphylococcus aureus]
MTLINIIFFMKHFLLFAFKIHLIYYRDMITKKTPTIFIRVLVKIHLIYYRDMITKKTPTIFIRVLVKIHKGVTI